MWRIVCLRWRDHPRIRGEHRLTISAPPPSNGSSPHTRGAPSRALRSLCRSLDHPRIRGEHITIRGKEGTEPGSSPHTRGAQSIAKLGEEKRRIIPAYAGSTLRARVLSSRATDHPRIRGEHRRGHGAWWSGRRIIPAYAGSTPAAVLIPDHTADHPRIRGEHNLSPSSARKSAGSSPHTRGALEELRQSESLRRIIPAYAGSTVEPSEMLTAQKDHPRIRGEHYSVLHVAEIFKGSSPHTRGARDGVPTPRTSARIIPAYAGSTQVNGVTFVSGVSSSPHTRGALATPTGGLDVIGIIPAYAGSTHPGRRRTAPGQDHPRIRGEHFSFRIGPGPFPGSSPHTRGARSPGRVGFPPRRIIPAYAGSTPPPGRVRLPGRDHPRIRGEHAPRLRT